MTATALVFAPVTAYIDATHADGSVETIPLARLTAEQAKESGLVRLRYVAFAVEGDWCVTRIESFDGAGHKLWRSGNFRAKTCN